MEKKQEAEGTKESEEREVGDKGEGGEGGEGGGKCLPPQLNKKIRDTYLPFGLEVEMCEGLSYSMMLQLEVCQEFTTTTTSIKTRQGNPI